MMNHTIPSSYVVRILNLGKQWHVEAADVLRDAGVDPEGLHDPHGRISLEAVLRVLGRTRALSGEPAFGYYLGLDSHVTAHGYLGFAALCARDVRQALTLTSEFFGIVTEAVTGRLRVDNGYASYILEERADFGHERDTVLLAILVGLWKIGETMTRTHHPGYVDLSMPEPDYYEHLFSLLPRVRFNQPLTRLHFPESLLDLPYVLGDPVALELARAQCERFLLERALSGTAASAVRAQLTKANLTYPSLDEVSGTMHISARTLKRRLSEEGTSFSTIVDDERRERAVRLLGNRRVSIGEVAVRLGFSTAANFTRAFQRWTGSTPSHFRRSLAR